MTPRIPPTCTHERRHGTATCLYCRVEEREASRTRRRRGAMRAAAIGGGALLLALAGFVAFGAARRGGTGLDDASATATAPEAGGAVAAAELDARTAAPVVPVGSLRTTPAIPVGRTALAGGMFAERTGDTVVVHFDVPMLRTRRADKFEQVVRSTLPAVLGEPARVALAAVAPGALVGAPMLQGAAGRVIRLPVGDGRSVVVVPGTRAGEDGPLVVTYQAVLDGAGPRG